MNYRKANRRAASILQDPERLQKLLASSIKKIRELRGNTQGADSLKQTVTTLNRMIRAYISGDYRRVPWKSLLLITTGILYFVSPLDLIPDFIPVLGMLDDITILIWIFKSLKSEIESFEEWEATFARPID